MAKLLRLGWSKTNSSLATLPKHLLIAQKTWHQRLLLWSAPWTMVVSLGPSGSSRNPQLIATRTVAILVILCRFARRNNSNYLPLLIALYVYSAGARVDAITLFNHLGPSVSYDVLQKKKKLRNITSTSTQWTRKERMHTQVVVEWKKDKFHFVIHWITRPE